MPLTLCVLLNAAPGQEARLAAYEDQVLQLVGVHGGRVRQRVRAVDGAVDPFEVHVLEFPSEASLQEYLDDPARLALAPLRDEVIESTRVIRVDVIE